MTAKIVKEEVPETLDLVVTEKSIGFLETNIEALENLVNKRLEDYKPENYLGDADLAKKDRAELNKAKEKIGRARIDLIAELMKPYNDFETRCKALEKKIEQASKALDEIVKQKENEEKELKRKVIEQFWTSKNFDLFPLEKIFNTKWLNKSFKESDILSEMDSRIEKTYKDLKVCERYSAMYGLEADSIKAHYLMNLDIEETISYCDELQRQKEIAQKEAAERAEREHKEKVLQQKEELWQEESNFENTQNVQNLAEMALNGGVEVEEKRKEFVISVKCFDRELLSLKGALNELGIEFSVEELTF
jgi:hypothetical protein